MTGKDEEPTSLFFNWLLVLFCFLTEKNLGKYGNKRIQTVKQDIQWKINVLV